MRHGVDVLIVSLGSTAGLRAADEELGASLRRAGVSVALTVTPPPPAVRTLALTDLAWALAARRGAQSALPEHRPRALLYSSTTAALLGPRPGAVRFDAPARANRPGRHGPWQRPAERRLLARAPVLVPWSAAGLKEAGPAARGRPAVTVPVPVEGTGGEPIQRRDIAAITYAANPTKKGLDRVLAAWRSVRRPGEELLVTGSDEVGPEEGIRVTGPLPPAEYRALLRRARLFVCAPRREDYGIAQLEALADGCRLVSTPAPGPYVALPLARALDPRLVDEDLARALRAALEDPDPGYAERAAQAIEPFSRAAVDRLVAGPLVSALLG